MQTGSPGRRGGRGRGSRPALFATVIVFAAGHTAALGAQPVGPRRAGPADVPRALLAHAAGPSTTPLAGFEDYTRPVGSMAEGELMVRLHAGPAVWQPWGEDGPSLVAHVFAADGAPPRVPAPLIRVRAGTPVRVTVRNGFDRPLVLHGFHDRLPRPELRRPGIPPGDTVIVDAGASTEIRYTPTVPGTFVFRGTLSGRTAYTGPALYSAEGADRAFVGVMIVDEPSPEPPPGERIFLITHWVDPRLPASFLPATRFFINGRSWPLTERLHVAQHDTVRWRILNFSGRPHPMHLHGFYFHVDARGDLASERVFGPAERRMVVTEVLAPAQTMRMSWLADEPGNWVFHCHLMRHMSQLQHAPLVGGPPGHGAHAHAPPGAEMMGGLVLGITVHPEAGATARTEPPRRRLDLHITRRPGVFGASPGYGFVLQQDARAPAADSIQLPGSLIALRRGEPTEIVVHNRADVALGVHWHGLELESRSDGVPGWSGMPGAVVPAIAPADSLRVRITPRRAGTFMYHVHGEPGHQLALGLYGPLLVTEPQPQPDAPVDLPFLLGSLGEGDDPPPAINGRTAHPPLELRAGSSYRLRFMHISPDDAKRVVLLAGDEPVQWRAVAKDGADLPPQQQRTGAAQLGIDVGETYDFLWTPHPGDYMLRVVTTFDAGAPLFPRPAPPPHTADIAITVR